MNCRDARALFSARFDGELSASESRDLELHVLQCAGCDRHWKSMSLTVRLVRTLPSSTPDPAFVARVLERVRERELAANRELVLASRRMEPWEALRSWVGRVSETLRESVLSPPQTVFSRPVVLGTATFALGLGLVSGYWVQDRRAASSDSLRASQLEPSTPAPERSRQSAASLPAGGAPSIVASEGSRPNRVSTSQVSANQLSANQVSTARGRGADPMIVSSRGPAADRQFRGFAGGALDSLTGETSPVEVLTPEWFVTGVSPMIQQTGANVRTF